MDCKNCGTIVEGRFCSHCGQNSNVSKVDIKYLIREIPNSIFYVNSGFLFAVKEFLRYQDKKLTE